jgi:hypothetical protein
MSWKISADSPSLRLICGLRWPQVNLYFMTVRHPGCWDFWELPPGAGQAEKLFGRLHPGPTTDAAIAEELLDFYLAAYRPLQRPEEEVLPGLMSVEEIRRVLERHPVRGSGE